MYVFFPKFFSFLSLCQAVREYALVWPVIRGVTLSDYGMATGFGLFNLPTCGPLPKGRDHSHVESDKHIYMSVLFIVVAVCLLLLFAVFFVIIIILYISSLELHVGCSYRFSLCMYMYSRKITVAFR